MSTTSTPTLTDALAQVRANLAAINVESFTIRSAKIAERRCRIDEAVADGESRMAEIVDEVAEVERIGVEAFDARHASTEFAILIGDREAEDHQSAAELVRERDRLRSALRGATDAINATITTEDALREDVRAAVAEACRPLRFYAEQRATQAMADLADAYALSKLAAIMTQGYVDRQLEESTAALHRALPLELPVPPEIVDTFNVAAPLLTLGRMAARPTIPAPRPSIDLSATHAHLRAA